MIVMPLIFYTKLLNTSYINISVQTGGCCHFFQQKVVETKLVPNASKPQITSVVDPLALPLARKSSLFHWFYRHLGTDFFYVCTCIADEFWHDEQVTVMQEHQLRQTDNLLCKMLRCEVPAQNCKKSVQDPFSCDWRWNKSEISNKSGTDTDLHT